MVVCGQNVLVLILFLSIYDMVLEQNSIITWGNSVQYWHLAYNEYLACGFLGYVRHTLLVNTWMWICDPKFESCWKLSLCGSDRTVGQPKSTQVVMTTSAWVVTCQTHVSASPDKDVISCETLSWLIHPASSCLQTSVSEFAWCPKAWHHRDSLSCTYPSLKHTHTHTLSSSLL